MKKRYCKRVVLSEDVYISMITETYDNINRETGGIFLGIVENGVWYVIHHIDPGYSNIVRRHAYFEYDTAYVSHQVYINNRLYKQPLEVLGIWHRHPGSFDSFSSIDDETNAEFAQLYPRGAISAIVNLDPRMRLTMYHVSENVKYRQVKVEVGNEHIPQKFLLKKRAEELLQREENRKPLPKALLDVVEKELELYLHNQKDYEYTIRPDGDEIDIEMKCTGTNNSIPGRVVVTFSVSEEGVEAVLNGTIYDYTPNIIKNFIFPGPEPETLGYTELLGVKPVCSNKDLHKAFKEKMKMYHPDTLAPTMSNDERDEATRMAQKVQEAYEYLSNMETVN